MNKSYTCTLKILYTYLVITIETASFNTLSPKTNIFNVGLTFNAWKIAKVATGSTAEIREPNAKLENSTLKL